MDPFLGVPWGQVGVVGGLLISLVFAIAMGWLYPRHTVKQMERVWKDRLADKDELIAELRSTNKLVDERNDQLAKDVGHLVEVGRTSAAALSALPTQTGGGR